MSGSYWASSKSPVVIYKNGGFALNPKNDKVIQNIVDNTEKMAKYVSMIKSNKNNSSKKSLF